MKYLVSSVKVILRLAIIISLLVALPASTAFAYADGPKNAGAGVNVPLIGTVAWENPGNIVDPSDANYSTITLSHANPSSNYLQARTYGFTIPTGATISGIEVLINRKADPQAQGIRDAVVSLGKADTIVGENKAVTTLKWPTVFTVATYGGPNDLWGTTWTPVDFDDFRVDFAVSTPPGSPTLNRLATVDYIQVSVYYRFGTETTISCNAASINYGDGITCVATVTRSAGVLTPTGTVDWSTAGSGLFETSPCTLAGSGGVATCSVTYTPDLVGTGSHLITAEYSGDDFFAASSDEQALTVSTRPVTVKADPLTKTFGDLDPVFTYQVTQGSLVFSDTFTGTLTRNPGEDAGQYAILQGSFALNLNYNLTYVGDFLSILKAGPSCELLNYSVTYDGSLHTADGLCTGVNDELLSGLVLTGTSHISAGTYLDTWFFTDVTGNYNNVTGTITDTITKADAVCVVTPYNVTYDGAAHTAEGACMGVLSEPLTGLDLSGTTHTNIFNYTDTWSFIDVTGNYEDTSGTLADFITGARLLLPLVTR